MGAAARGTGTEMVIFGASGDLTRRKILPAIESLRQRGELPPGFRVVGAGRSQLATEDFREIAGAGAEWCRLDYGDPASFAGLRDLVAGTRNAIFYLATPPTTFGAIINSLAASGLVKKGDATRRVVLEKPLGQDAATARTIDRDLATSLDEAQVFRIDHYLAKDTVQNTLAFRFSNSVFEPIWNRTLIESIQLTAAEEEGIGKRAGYYDQIGAVRDVVQNHVLQVLALVTMEPPTSFDPAAIRTAKLEALRAMQPIDVGEAVRGQYAGYLDEPGVTPESRRETYAAARIALDNWRWDGVPIYVRAGKALRRRATEVVIRFRDAPHLRIGGRRHRGIPTLLVIRIQPQEGITLRIGAKLPGARFEMVPAGMSLEYARLSRAPLPDAYEHVLREVMAGGHSVFPSGAEIVRSWEIVDPLIAAWEQEGHPEPYARQSWGPGAAEELVAATGGGRWLNPGEEPGTTTD